MDDEGIRGRLVKWGKELLNAPKEDVVRFTGVAEADALVNDLGSRPHAYVLANLMNRQVSAERAWRIPYEMAKRIGDFSMAVLRGLSLRDVKRLMKHPSPLHRFADKMSGVFHSAVQRIHAQYADDASRLWADRPYSAEVVCRFLEFDGVGSKIANLATNDLARKFKIPFADYSAIDVSADVHVRRVFSRLGLCGPDPSPEQVIYKAKALHPEFPGLMDLPCWEIGRKWCKAREPACGRCAMQDVCPTPNKRRGRT